MPRHHRWTLVLTIAAVLLAPAAARAACPGGNSQPFAHYLDAAWYRLAASGDVGYRASSWSLSGGAAGVRSQTSRDLAGSGQPWVADVPAGASATSPPTCVSLDAPTVRFMARSTGSPLGVLLVSAVVGDGEVPLGVVTGLGSTWKPSLPMLLPTANLVALDGATTVGFRFEAAGLGGEFEVDDVFVDPYRKN